MAADLRLTKKDCPTEAESVTMAESQRWYRSTAASFIYFGSWTRPDLSFTISKLCKFMHNPGAAHMTALKRAIRYLATTADQGLVYDFGPHCNTKSGAYGYYDASHADCPDTMKSTLAYVFFFSGCSMSWTPRATHW